MLITDKEKLSQFYSCRRVWQGIPGIVRTKKGRTFVSFYSGKTAETFGNYAVIIKSDDDKNFSEPIAVAKKDGDFRCFDPVLWIDPLNRLWFFWNVMPGEEVFAVICENPDADELTWSKEIYIGRGVMMNKPTVLSSGEWLFPIAVWKRELYPGFRISGLEENEIAGSYVYKSSDNGKTFVRMGMADVHNRSFDEHMILELNSGILKMFVRANYGIGVSSSYDRGKTWSVGENSKLGGPCSRFFISRLKSGRILLINHYNFCGRNNLTALLSEDDGKTYPYSLLLDERSNVSYPDAIECDDGFIYITYDRDRGCFKTSLSEAYECAREILTAKITEEDIIKGTLTNTQSFLKNVVNKLGILAPDEPDPYIETTEVTENFIDTLLEKDKNEIIEKIFERYPINCIDVAKLDMVKLDTLIEHFQKEDIPDRKLLLKIIDLIRFSQKPMQGENPTIKRIYTYVQEHLTEDFTVSSVAREMNISIYYLSHLFKTVTGISILEFRNEARLTKAKHLLINTDNSISEIALQCGYSNASYFAEIFSRSEKVSPTDFRKYHTKKA